MRTRDRILIGLTIMCWMILTFTVGLAASRLQAKHEERRPAATAPKRMETVSYGTWHVVLRDSKTGKDYLLNSSGGIIELQ